MFNMFHLRYDIIYQINPDKPFVIKKDREYFIINKKKYKGSVRGNKGYLKEAFISKNSRPSVWFEIKDGNPNLITMSIQAGNRAIFFLIAIGLFNLIFFTCTACAIAGIGGGTTSPFEGILVIIFFDIFFLLLSSFIFYDAKSSTENDFKKEFKLKKISEKGTYKIRRDF